jgi:hypothetical protein
VSWKATASASTASMPPATSVSRTPNDRPGAPTLTLVTAARLRMCWTAWAAATTVDPRTRRRVGATVLVQDDDGGRGVDGDPENLGVDDPVQLLLAGAELGGERPLGPADRAEGAEPAGGPSPRHAEGPRATVGVRGNLIVTLDFSRWGAKYYKVTEKVDAEDLGPGCVGTRAAVAAGVDVGVGPGRPVSLSAGGFPRPALRTGRATSTASGSPRGHAAGAGIPVVLDHGVGILVPRYR